MGRPVFIRTTNIQATGCNLRVSKETTEFDDVIFFFTFSEYYGITPSFWLVLPSYWWCRRARWQVWKLHPVALILTSVSFKKQQKKKACFHTHTVIQKMSAQIWQTVQNWSDLGRKKDQIPFNAFWKGAGKGEEGRQAMKMRGDKKLRGQRWALVKELLEGRWQRERQVDRNMIYPDLRSTLRTMKGGTGERWQWSWGRETGSMCWQK